MGIDVDAVFVVTSNINDGDDDDGGNADTGVG